MTTEIFKASNGIQIEHGEGNFIKKRMEHLSLDNLGNYMQDSAMDQAVAEFYQARRDNENGVYRSKKHPTVTVRVVSAGGTSIDARVTDPSDPSAMFRAYDEANGRTTTPLNRRMIERRADGLGVKPERVYLYKAMMEFLETSPVRKPVWHNAEPGSVWVVTLKNRGPLPARVVCGPVNTRYFEFRNLGGASDLPVTHTSIEYAVAYAPVERSEEEQS